MVKLGCAVNGDGSVFCVDISLSATVEDLQHAIFYKLKYNQRYKFGPSALKIYLARDRRCGAWLRADDTVMSFLRARLDSNRYLEMVPLWRLDEDAYFGVDFKPEYKDVHILVDVPAQREAMIFHAESAQEIKLPGWSSTTGRVVRGAAEDTPFIPSSPPAAAATAAGLRVTFGKAFDTGQEQLRHYVHSAYHAFEQSERSSSEQVQHRQWWLFSYFSQLLTSEERASLESKKKV